MGLTHAQSHAGIGHRYVDTLYRAYVKRCCPTKPPRRHRDQATIQRSLRLPSTAVTASGQRASDRRCQPTGQTTEVRTSRATVIPSSAYRGFVGPKSSSLAAQVTEPHSSRRIQLLKIIVLKPISEASERAAHSAPSQESLSCCQGHVTAAKRTPIAIETRKSWRHEFS
jgi:hypothetical protein